MASGERGSPSHHRLVARVLLVLPSSTYRARDFLEAARALGVEVVVGSDEPHVLHSLAGSRAVQVPLGDPEAGAESIVAHDSVAPLDAIVAVDDQGAAVAAAASQRLGLRHNRPDAVAATRDKVVMRSLLARSEVPQPVFTTLRPHAPERDIAAVVDAVGFPCVVKPTTLSASQGVLRADSLGELTSAVDRVSRIAVEAGAAGLPLLVERFVSGPEVAVEGLLTDGSLDVLAVFDKPDPLEGPAFEETLYVTPSRLDQKDMKAVVDTTRQAVEALGLSDGPVHAELRVHRGRAWIIEVAARTIGGLCSRALSFATGRTLEQLVLAHALGLESAVDLRDERSSGVLMIPIPRAGTLLGVQGTSRALSIPGITDVQLTIPPGRRVAPPPEGNRYLGFVFARARRPADVERALRGARRALEVRIDD